MYDFIPNDICLRYCYDVLGRNELLSATLRHMPKEATSSSEVASHTTTLRSLTNTPRSRTTDVEVDDDNDDAMSTLNRNLRDWVDDTSSYKRKRQRDETVDTVDIARSEYIQAKAKALAESTQLKNDETREALMKTREVLLL